MASKFQHRHYAAIAAVLADALKRESCDLDKVEVVERITDDLAGLFARDNGNFQRPRFLAAARGNASGKDKVR